MLCLYKPYSFSRIEAGGFSDPVRILLTVLRAWLNTLSIVSHVCKLWSVRKGYYVAANVREAGDVPTESDMIGRKSVPAYGGVGR
jgi:hypothetical protein